MVLQKIPKVKKISNKKLVETLQEELVRKDKLIEKLRRENALLLSVSLKNAKRRLEDKD